jgi:hypothetical protein
MWTSNKKNWEHRTTELEKFLIERIIQRCDYEEVLSNQHRTTNGYTLIHELLKLSILSKTRARTIKTVLVLFEESKNELLNQTILTDPIIQKYFNDIYCFIKTYETKHLLESDSRTVNLSELNKLIHKLKKFSIQLEKSYYPSLRKNFYSIDYSDSNQFMRHADEIAVLVDILIPYLVFKGYAVSSLSEVLKSWIEKKYSINIKRIFTYFDMKSKKYQFLIKVNQEIESDYENVIDLLGKETNSKITYGDVNNLKDTFEGLNIFQDTDKVIIYESTSYLDPHIHFRTVYDRLLKRIVLQREKQSLSLFNSFFSLCFWRVQKKGKYYHNIELVNDPINVSYRGQTLIDLLVRSSQVYGYDFDNRSKIPELKNNQLNSSLYYYNLALGSKSIENSLSLLWTSLEALLPYRLNNSDIECIQSFVSTSLSIGSVCRDIIGLSNRIGLTNTRNNQALKSIIPREGIETDIKTSNHDWFTWITDETSKDNNFKYLISESNLLAYEYTRIAKPLINGKLKYIEQRIIRSNLSIKYQLQRIYLHRNQIIHAGNLINEYTNLWMHLEWYIGKLLGYAIIKLELINSFENLEDVFSEIESDYEYLMSYLKLNENKQIVNLSGRIQTILLEYNWQSF